MSHPGRGTGCLLRLRPPTGTMNAATLQQDSDYHPTIRHSQSGHVTQDVTYHGPGECTPERCSRNPLLGALPLQDWTEVRAGQGIAHALTAPCRWGPRCPDRPWHWL